MTSPTVPQPTAPAPTAVPEQQPAQAFSRDDVNRIVADRLAREAKKYEGFDDLKAKAARLDEIEAQNASELDKATRRAADEARAELMTATNTRLVRAEVKAAAAARQFHDPADAPALLERRFGQVKVDDNGDVDDDAVKALVEELAKEKPHLVKASNGAAPKPLAGQGTPSSGSPSGREAGLAEARRRFGEPKTTT